MDAKSSLAVSYPAPAPTLGGTTDNIMKGNTLGPGPSFGGFPNAAIPSSNTAAVGYAPYQNPSNATIQGLEAMLSLNAHNMAGYWQNFSAGPYSLNGQYAMVQPDLAKKGEGSNKTSMDPKLLGNPAASVPSIPWNALNHPMFINSAPYGGVFPHHTANFTQVPSVSNNRKRKLNNPLSFAEAGDSLDGKLKGPSNSRIRKLVTYLEKVERPRTWTQEETYCLVLVVVNNESLVKHARYKELHLEFLENMKTVFAQQTRKTRQAFWARHCRIREKLGVEQYERLFWQGKPVPSIEETSKRSKSN